MGGGFYEGSWPHGFAPAGTRSYQSTVEDAAAVLAWLLGRPGVHGPVIGARSLAQLQQNFACLTVQLDARRLAELDAVSDPGLPHPQSSFAQYGFPWR
jgi:aryl-alcohol dehydrogenase-like predicted oxidoreductase